MARHIIHTAQAPSSQFYSQAIRTGSTVFVSGMIGIDPNTKELAGQTIQEQTRQSLANCEAVLRAADASLKDVVEVLVLLARPGDFSGMNEAYTKVFPADPPARAVAKLGVELPDVLVSIKMTAVVRSD